jgi:hypothetical protein
MGVKGSWQRPKQVDEQTYNDNWDKIFGRKKEPEPKEQPEKEKADEQ